MPDNEYDEVPHIAHLFLARGAINGCGLRVLIPIAALLFVYSLIRASVCFRVFTGIAVEYVQ